MQTLTRKIKFGLVGTGHWARITHAPALASVPGIDFVGVWGRDAAAATALATDYGIRTYADVDGLIADVDALAFAVPPNVQSAIAIRAANAGKHLLLEKPIALSDVEADALLRAVDDAQVASVVFFTALFQPEVRTWVKKAQSTPGWSGGNATWIGSALTDANPFNTPWRREKGGLWDLAAHAIAIMQACLGPVESVTAEKGRGDLTCLILHHREGATSTITVTIDGPDAAAGFDLSIWGKPGRLVLPESFKEPQAALQVALTDLTMNVQAGRTAHPCDVHLGREVVRVLASAQRQIDISGGPAL
jgi:predicted dehydrogenase